MANSFVAAIALLSLASIGDSTTLQREHRLQFEKGRPFRYPHPASKFPSSSRVEGEPFENYRKKVASEVEGLAVKDAPDQKDKEKAGEAPSAGGKDISVDGEGSGGGGAEEDGGEGEKRKKTDASQTTERIADSKESAVEKLMKELEEGMNQESEKSTTEKPLSTSEGSGSSKQEALKGEDYDAILKSLLDKSDEDTGSSDLKSSKTGAIKEIKKEKDLRPQEIIEIKGGKKEDSSKTDDESLVNELLESVKNKLKDHKTSTMVKEEPNVKKIIPQDIVTSNNDQSAVESNSGEESLPKSYRLKNIRSLISPDLLYTLAKAGEGDTFVLAGNGFPALETITSRFGGGRANTGGPKIIRMDGLPITLVLKEIMKLISISTRSKYPLLLMKPIGSSNVTSNSDHDSQIWQSFKDIVERADQRKYQWAKLNRNKFITEARKALAVIQTGEPNLDSSLIITKGRIPGVMSQEKPKETPIGNKKAAHGDSELIKRKQLEEKLTELKDKEATTISSSKLFSFMTTTKPPGGEVILPTVAKKLIEIPDTKAKDINESQLEQIPAIEKVSKTARKLGGKKKEDFSITDQELKNASLDELRAKLAAMRAAGGIKD